MDELQEMREQMAALKEKLNKQEIVNERLMRDVLVKKQRKDVIGSWVLLIFLGSTLVLTWTLKLCMPEIDVDWWQLGYLTIASVLVLVSVITPVFMIKMKDIRSGQLLDVAKQMKRSHAYINGQGHKLWILLMILGLVFDFTPSTFHGGKVDWVGVCMSIVCLATIFIIGIVRRSRGKSFYRNRWEKELEQIEEMSDLDEKNDKEEKGL
ncbi:MAG: hypothetical protein IKT83_08175 [Bacteroidaceae bacterium]|nr:hypothetical protein [Bacteroidaceae bacterium]